MRNAAPGLYCLTIITVKIDSFTDKLSDPGAKKLRGFLFYTFEALMVKLQSFKLGNTDRYRAGVQKSKRIGLHFTVKSKPISLQIPLKHWR